MMYLSTKPAAKAPNTISRSARADTATKAMTRNTTQRTRGWEAVSRLSCRNVTITAPAALALAGTIAMITANAPKATRIKAVYQLAREDSSRAMASTGASSPQVP